MKDIKLSDYAKMKSVTYRTVWNRFKQGKLPNAYMDETNHVYVSLEDSNCGNKTIVYARVINSSLKF